MTNFTEHTQFPSVIQWETDTRALGGTGGPMNIPLQQLVNRTAWLKAQVDILTNAVNDFNSLTVEDLLTSTSTVNPLAANQGRVLKGLHDDVLQALNNKVDISAYNDRYKGLHITLANLQASYPSAQSGDYAIVDAGAGSDGIIYFWDVDGGWVTNGSTVSLTDTDALAEGSLNLYFTAQRAIIAVDAAFARYDQVQTLTLAQKLTFHSNVGTYDYDVKTITDNYYALTADDSTGRVYLRMDCTVANNVVINTLLTRTITIRQCGVGITTLLAADAGITLYGNLVFAGPDDTKTIMPLGNGAFDVIGAAP